MKKKRDANGLDEILAKIKQRVDLNDIEKRILQAALLLEGQREKVFNSLFYRYEKPEYETMSAAAWNWLLPKFHYAALWMKT